MTRNEIEIRRSRVIDAIEAADQIVEISPKGSFTHYDATQKLANLVPEELRLRGLLK
jgi:hypothetical protein